MRKHWKVLVVAVCMAAAGWLGVSSEITPTSCSKSTA
jgi:hypothetical protein